MEQWEEENRVVSKEFVRREEKDRVVSKEDETAS